MNKVIGGTPQGSQSLCATCRFAQNMRGLNMQQESICLRTQPNRLIKFPVETCSGYDDKRIPSLYDMENIAWRVQTRNRGPAGFAPDGTLEVEIERPNMNPNQPRPVTG